MLLFLLRHGDALVAGYDDARRPLSLEGELQSYNAGRFLRRCGVEIQLIIASPLLRAQQMADIVREELSIREPILTSEHLTPHADQRQVIRLLNTVGRERVVMVGHEPHLSTLISVLVSGSRAANVEMQKGNCACIVSKSPVEAGSGILKWVLPQELMLDR
jgi:phosphohistidine phosphatase